MTRLTDKSRPRTRRDLYFNAVPIRLIYDRWTSEYSAFWANKATDLKFLVEASGVHAAQPA